MIEHNDTVIEDFKTDGLKRATTAYSKANIKLAQSLGKDLPDGTVKALVDALFYAHALLVEAVEEYAQDRYEEGFEEGIVAQYSS